MRKLNIVLTGVVQGMGKDVLKLIHQRNPDYNVVATSFLSLPEIRKNIDTQFPNNKTEVMHLDLSKPQSIKQFSQELAAKNFKIDCLINNAAVGADRGDKIPTPELAERTFNVNVYGTTSLIQNLLPLLKEDGRIVNVSSRMSGLRNHGKDIVEKFSNNKITFDQIKKEIDWYIEGCRREDLGQYYHSAYGTSKMMLNTWTRFMLKPKLKPTQTVILMTPGQCQTSMGAKTAVRTSLDGANAIYSYIHGEYSSDVFYHIDEKWDFYNCGPL